MIKKGFIFSCFFAAALVSAQQKHKVIKGDNPYNIAKKYGMSLDELYSLNPKVKAGTFNIGDIVAVKGSAKAVANSTIAKTENSGKIGKIVLKPKQTIYGITKQYHISEAELRKLNPELDSNMKIGSEIALPLANIQKYAELGLFLIASAVATSSTL